MSGNEFARQLGWQQSRVSKLETGVQLPSDDDLAIWTQATDANAAEIRSLRQLRARAKDEYETWRAEYARAGGVAVQNRLRDREQHAATILEFWPAMMPGLVQTAEYAREVLSSPSGPTAWGTPEDEIENLVAARIQRQDVLYAQKKQIRIIVGEAALRTRFGPVETLIGQLDRLVAVAGLANVDFGVVSFDAALPVYPIGMFKVYDADMVMIESLAGEQVLYDPDAVATYTKFFDLLHNVAATGSDAVSLIQRVAAELRQA